jgi:hypothetical protein
MFTLMAVVGCSVAPALCGTEFRRYEATPKCIASDTTRRGQNSRPPLFS